MGKGDRKKVLVTQECQECGCRMPMWRLRSKLKDGRHVKHMWCPQCMGVTEHRQVSEWK